MAQTQQIRADSQIKGLTGTSSGISGVSIQDEGIPQGNNITTFNFIGGNVDASVSGAVVRVFVTGTQGIPGPAGTFGVFGQDEGVPLGTGTILNFVGPNVDASISGTVIRVFVTGSTGGLSSVSIQDEGIVQGNATVFNFLGDAVWASVSGTVANISVSGTTGPASGDLTGTYPSPEVLQVAKSFKLAGIANYTGTTSARKDDFYMDGLNDATVLTVRVANGAGQSFSGISGGVPNRILFLQSHITGSLNYVQLLHDSPFSSPENRFDLGPSTQLNISEDRGVLLRYTNSRWTVIGTSQSDLGTLLAAELIELFGPYDTPANIRIPVYDQESSIDAQFATLDSILGTAQKFVTGTVQVYNTGTLVTASARRFDFQYPLYAQVTGGFVYPSLSIPNNGGQFLNGLGQWSAPSGTVQLFSSGTFLGSVNSFDFKDPLYAGITGSKAYPTMYPDSYTHQDGWIPVSETWTYASASTFTVVGDRTARYRTGTKLKWTQTTVKYGIVASSSYSAPNTTVTIITNNDYTIANAAITSPHVSHIDDPDGFPDWFNWTPTLSASGSMTWTSTSLNYAIYRCNGRTLFFQISASGTTGGTASTDLRATWPITPDTTNYGASTWTFAANYRDATSGNTRVGTGIGNGSFIIVRTIDATNYTLGAGRTMLASGFCQF